MVPMPTIQTLIGTKFERTQVHPESLINWYKTLCVMHNVISLSPYRNITITWRCKWNQK